MLLKICVTLGNTFCGIHNLHTLSFETSNEDFKLRGGSATLFKGTLLPNYKKISVSVDGLQLQLCSGFSL